MGNDVWVILQQREGALHRMSIEAIGVGQKLAATTGGQVIAVLLGHDVGAIATTVAAHAVASVQVGDAEALADYTPGGYRRALTGALRDAAPTYVVAPHTYQSVDFVPRLAQAIDAALVPEIIGIEQVDGETLFKRPILGGKLHARVRVKGEGTTVVTIQSGAFSASDAQKGDAPASIEALAMPAEIASDRTIVGIEQVGDDDQVDLSKADVIIAAGRGVGGADKMGPIEALAAALGADIGASRPVIDSGWLPRDRQIGSSGQTVAPKLYIAAGVSGAIQHLVGMKGSSTIVAINKDKSAPIFNVAHYGVIGDLHEIVPALTAAIEEAKG
ncbi:MAG: electron transfer flavoprotein subunit alpha/FixB family protein [Acidobacteriota bacterium]